MGSRETAFRPVVCSLTEMVGEAYVEAVAGARAFLTGEDPAEARSLADRPVEFFPASLHARLLELLPRVGTEVCFCATATSEGATTAAFARNSKLGRSPLSALGYLRIGEDGRLCFSSKSEHYHAPLGHDFPGFRLIEHARRLGIPNATHNNTRGHITRLLETSLVDAANPGTTPHLDRVLNLETGSLAAEAAVKMMLSRFYRAQADSPAPVHGGRTPVFLVMGDPEGGLSANYHGTTVLTQMMRGMWHDLLTGLESEDLLRVQAVRANDMQHLEEVFEKCDEAPLKIAGFLHELVLMNYGGVRLSRDFVTRAYALCQAHGVPTLVDEIQTGIWSPELFLFREYGIEPDFVALGKGFPGGEYPASRLLFNSEMDSLPQFGALVTNGQEELASLAYLITMHWARENADVTRAVGEYYEDRVRAMADANPGKITRVEGLRHMLGIYFSELSVAKDFAARLNDAGLDISVQTYKAETPPSALTKLPLITGFEAVDFVLDKMEQALENAGGGA